MHRHKSKETSVFVFAVRTQRIHRCDRTISSKKTCSLWKKIIVKRRLNNEVDEMSDIRVLDISGVLDISAAVRSYITAAGSNWTW